MLQTTRTSLTMGIKTLIRLSRLSSLSYDSRINVSKEYVANSVSFIMHIII